MDNLYNNFKFPENYAEYCKGIHPALRVSFDCLREELYKRVDLGLISCSKKENLEVFKYTQKTVHEKQWDYFTLMARGLVLSSEKVVGLCFLKFFNYNEIFSVNNIFEKDFVTTKKMDGSLGLLYKYGDNWIVSTGGSFISEQAKWGQSWAIKNMNLDKANDGATYLFEIIYPENKIVIDYDFSGMVLLGMYDQNGIECDYNSLKIEASNIGVKLTDVYNFSDMESILENVKNLTHQEEGYVIRFSNGVRLKVKGDEYVRIHRLISKVTPLSIWEALLHKEDMELIANELPEEIKKDYWKIIEILQNNFKTIIKDIVSMYEKTEHMSDKDLGLFLQKRQDTYVNDGFSLAKKYIFSYRKGLFGNKINDPNSKLRKDIFTEFRPKSNHLDGYTPSNIMNRFDDNI